MTKEINLHTLISHDYIYLVRPLCETTYLPCPEYLDCEDCTYNSKYNATKQTLTTSIIRSILDSECEEYALGETCFLSKDEAQAKVQSLNNPEPTYTCVKCNLTFSELKAYKWRINNRIIDCCPKCKQPLMYARNQGAQ